MQAVATGDMTLDQMNPTWFDCRTPCLTVGRQRERDEGDVDQTNRDAPPSKKTTTIRDDWPQVSPISFEPGVSLLLDEKVERELYPWESVVALQVHLEVRPVSFTPNKTADSAATTEAFKTPDAAPKTPGGSPAPQGYECGAID